MLTIVGSSNARMFVYKETARSHSATVAASAANLPGVGPRADPQADRKTMLPRSGPEAGTTKEVAWSEKDRLTWAESVTVATPAHPPRARL